MANFSKAIPHILTNEGGYANDPHDRGGETFAGISRKNFPNWEGWATLDKTVSKNMLLRDEVFMDKVEAWYKVNFWDAIKGDSINDDRVALNIFDFAVNAGTHKAIEKAQKVAKVTADGIIGPMTITAINGMNPDEFVIRFQELRIEYYKAIVLANPSQSKWLAGWMKRAEEC